MKTILEFITKLFGFIKDIREKRKKKKFLNAIRNSDRAVRNARDWLHQDDNQN